MIPVGATWYRGMDLVAVQRVMEGLKPFPELTVEEQQHATREMDSTGWTAGQIAERLGVSSRTVGRWLTEGEA